MPRDRSTRTLLSVVLLLAGIFVAIDRLVEKAPPGDWWLPLALLVVGGGIALTNWLEDRRAAQTEAEGAPGQPGGQPANAPADDSDSRIILQNYPSTSVA